MMVHSPEKTDANTQHLNLELAVAAESNDNGVKGAATSGCGAPSDVKEIVVDLGSAVPTVEAEMSCCDKAERDCRICHLGIDVASQESGAAIELGCSCKDDLGAAHKHCAEAWFKIKGNRTCEICGSEARNVGSLKTPLSEECQEMLRGCQLLKMLMVFLGFVLVLFLLSYFKVQVKPVRF